VSSPHPLVSVIVPVYNAERALPRLMDSLRRQRYPSERVEIVLVDNNSTDRSAEVMRSFPEVKACAFTERQSSYGARNVGVEASRGEALAFIDADCWAHPDWLAEGVAGLNKGADRVAGRVEFVMSAYPNFYETFDAALNFGQPDFVSRGWSGAGNLFIRRKVFDDVGMWDPTLISNGDCEFGLRATATGKTLVYRPKALIYHRARRTFMSLVKKWIRTEYGAAQAWRRHGIQELHLWTKKANYRPLLGAWKSFPPEIRANPRMRLAIALLSNILRYAGNFGNFLGYFGLRQFGLGE